jgi:predicted protein tyrosine phosphatase
VNFRTTICGIAELAGHGTAGVTHVLSLLDPGWPDPEALAAYPAHRRLDLRFYDLCDALPGLRRPEPPDIDALLAFGRELAAPGAHLLVHCQMGLSRSTAALALVLAQAWRERTADEIVAAVVALRPHAWPNLRIIELGDALLQRKGALIAAVAACYRARIAARPQLADGMIEMGRARELALALGA